MLYIKDGSKTRTILEVVALTGEFPAKAVKLLGDYNSWRRRIVDMTKKQTYRNNATGEQYECAALYITGKGGDKSIRLTKQAMPLLDWIGNRKTSEETTTRFSGPEQAERTHRVAEAILMFHFLGVPIQKKGNPKKGNLPVFVTSKSNYDTVKNCLDKAEVDKHEIAMFTRVVGAYMCEGTCMAVYNTRSTKMKWTPKTENKTKSIYQLYANTICKSATIDALMFGTDYEIGYETMTNETHLGTEHKTESFFDLYRNTYFVPLNDYGKKLLRILTMPDFVNKLPAILMPEQNRRKGYGLFDYDGIVDGQYVISFLDSNVARLTTFRLAVDVHFDKNPDKYGIPRIVCYPEQEQFVRNLFSGYNYDITKVEIDAILKRLKL